MSRKRPNRYSSDHSHRVYGIRNWFRKIEITNRHHQDAMIFCFLTDFGWDFKGKEYKDIDVPMGMFIDNRWKKFTQYVQKNYKLWLELQYTHSI